MFQKQKMMRKVLYSLIPIFLFSIYLYGWRTLAIGAVVFSAGILTEYLFMKQRKKKVSEAVLVSCALYTLSMPPKVPLWIAVAGIVFGILFGKCIYGGFGRNVFNPAITGRLFVYITFPLVMTRGWMTPGAFGTLGVDAMTSATPLEVIRSGNISPLIHLVTGLRMGSLGESAIILILVAAVYLLVTKTASWRSLSATLVSFLLLQSVLFYWGVINTTPLESLLSGSVLFIAVFMVTDPISSPKKNMALLLYGIIIGISLALIRDFSLFPEGSSFAILMGNTFAPLLDDLAAKVGIRKKVKP